MEQEVEVEVEVQVELVEAGTTLATITAAAGGEVHQQSNTPDGQPRSQL